MFHLKKEIVVKVNIRGEMHETIEMINLVNVPKEEEGLMTQVEGVIDMKVITKIKMIEEIDHIEKMDLIEMLLEAEAVEDHRIETNKIRDINQKKFVKVAIVNIQRKMILEKMEEGMIGIVITKIEMMNIKKKIVEVNMVGKMIIQEKITINNGKKITIEKMKAKKEMTVLRKLTVKEKTTIIVKVIIKGGVTTEELTTKEKMIIKTEGRGFKGEAVQEITRETIIERMKRISEMKAGKNMKIEGNKNLKL